MLFMIIERFKDRDPVAVYARLREQGRALPDGLRYVDSWVEANFDRCFQIIEAADTLLLQQWVLQWRDLVEFEIVPVSPSKAIRELLSQAGDANGGTAALGQTDGFPSSTPGPLRTEGTPRRGALPCCRCQAPRSGSRMRTIALFTTVLVVNKQTGQLS